MRALCASLLVFVALAAASAADLAVKVIDPQSAAVPGAQVQLLKKDGAVLHTATSIGDGSASFGNVPNGDYQVQVLAPGFARLTISVTAPRPDPVTAQLELAPATEVVVVTATRTPVPAAESGASVSLLDAAELQVMQPMDASDALRFLPGAIVDTSGQRGGLASLFVRGGDSRYNKVLIDNVPVNDSGGTMDFGVIPLSEVSRVEFARGAQSTLYGSDAMTSVVQAFSTTGNTHTPELRFGGDGGNFDTAHGFASVSGARDRWDFNFFGDQFNSAGKGPNDEYSNSLQGGNVGLQLSPNAVLRVRARHANSHTGVQGEWDFNNQPLLAPDRDQQARTNDLLSSAELTLNGPSGWQHRLIGFEYNHRRQNEDTVPDRGCDPVNFVFLDCPFNAVDHFNRAGFDYQGDYAERSWTHTTLGYEFEDENAFVGDPTAPHIPHGVRRNHAVYAQQLLQISRLSVVAGGRFVHNETFGNKFVPRVALSYLALRGSQFFSGTRLRFSYATGIKEARFEESLATGLGIVPNPNLKAEENRAFETGIEQSFLSGKYAFSAIYFNNLFRNQIDFAIIDPITFTGEYENIDKSFAHGAEVEFRGRLLPRLLLDAAYNYASTQILEQPFAFDAQHQPGSPLLRRPKHSGSVLLSYLGSRWGASLGASIVGRRPDSDFLVSPIPMDHAAGYARVDIGGWYAINSRLTTYANVENALDRRYNEVVGYPSLPVNFRAGFRFRIGGE
ncbi:MAG TPA: TonB-dependent receptor [Candidatus Acidoferrum sp.]|nr:TonB-dependent receptor [Candidatus Acidoferrum sp.]